MKIQKFFATTVTIFLLLMVSGFAAYLFLGATQKSNQLLSGFKVSVYLSDTLTNEQISVIEQQIKGDNKVASVTVVSKQAAAKEFTQKFGIAISEKNPLPVSLRVTLKAGVDTKNYVNTVSKLSGVEQVDYPSEIVADVKNNLSTISKFANAFCVVLVLVVLIIFRNAIRMDVAASVVEIDYAVKRKMHPSEIRQPFLVRAFTQGAIAGGLASLFLFLATDGVATIYPSTKLPIDLSVMFVIFAVMILCAMLLSWLFAYFAVQYQIKNSLNKR